MRALLDIVGADMVAGIQTEKLTGEKKVGDKVWNMMTEFRINVESGKASIKRDIRLIEKQIAQMDDSREMLFGIKRNIEGAKRQ
jgi:polyhydroxyalkanoate synthesis regulator phasin